MADQRIVHGAKIRMVLKGKNKKKKKNVYCFSRLCGGMITKKDDFVKYSNMYLT